MAKRVFVAITPGRESSELIEREVDWLRARAAVENPEARIRWVEREKRHLTLGFARSADSSALGELETALSQIVTRTNKFEMRYQGGGVFPGLPRPQVLWTGVGEGREAVEALGEAVSETLASLGIGERGRSFTPHLTLARLRKPTDLAWAVEILSGFETPSEQIDSIELYESELLGASGSRYSLLKEFNLS